MMPGFIYAQKDLLKLTYKYTTPIYVHTYIDTLTLTYIGINAPKYVSNICTKIYVQNYVH